MSAALRFHEDPGHGWLEVPVVELHRLGIAEKITAYSYLSRCGRIAYLEEDCDLSTFARAAGWPATAWPASVEIVRHRGDCFVRSLPRYAPAELHD